LSLKKIIMAHFCKINSQNIVELVVVVDNSVLLDENNTEQEFLGIEYLKSIYGQNTNWVQTSYHGNFRKLFAGTGFIYKPQEDIFVFPQPYPSWTFNQVTQDWDPPIPFPNDGEGYYWDEESQTWILL